MGEVTRADSGDAESGPAALMWTLQEQMNHMSGALQALAKDKGKGKGKGMPQGKGGGKGDGKGGGKGDVFDGTCNHCGKYGHRKNACRQLDREMATKRGDDPKAIRELGAEDNAEQPEAEEGDWTFGTMWAVTKDPPVQQ